MYHYDFITQGTCAKLISIDLEGDVVKNVEFQLGGCPGNLQAVPNLVQGMTIDEIAGKISGIQCGSRGTSCADQLVKGLRAAYDAQQRGEVQSFED